MFPLEPPFNKGSRIDPRGSMTLKIDKITSALMVRTTKEVIETNLVKSGG